MSAKHPDRLARRVRKLEDKQRRDLLALKREVLAAITHHDHSEPTPWAAKVAPNRLKNGGTYHPSDEY